MNGGFAKVRMAGQCRVLAFERFRIAVIATGTSRQSGHRQGLLGHLVGPEQQQLQDRQVESASGRPVSPLSALRWQTDG